MRIGTLIFMTTMLVAAMPVAAELDKGRAAEKAASVTPEEGRAFFDRYVRLGEAFDPTVADLYTASSRVKARRTYPGGVVRDMEIPGAQWGTMIRSVMPVAKAKGDVSKYSNVRTEVEGERLRVRADRYAVLKCYTDKNYYMLVGKESGKLYVAEEFFDNQPQSSC